MKNADEVALEAAHKINRVNQQTMSQVQRTAKIQIIVRDAIKQAMDELFK